MHRISYLLAAFALFCAAPASAQSDDPRARDLIHSDLPLFGNSAEETWPRSFRDEDSFGCTSRVAVGDWVFREAGAEDDNYAAWYRVRNYGAFHCFAVVSSAYPREALDGADGRPSFFVLLGTVENPNIELWAAQLGAMPGSDYLLLSRAPGEGLITSFNVLQSECPRANVRDAGALDILLTRYCAINTRADLLRLARTMARRPPLGVLTQVRDGGADDE